MAITVHTDNLKSINNLNKVSDRLTSAMVKLSTGYKINSASDGAAQLMLSNGLEKQISGLSVCNNNAYMAQSILSVADGSLSQITSLAQRIRDIALSSANGIYGDMERTAYQQEVDGLVDEIKRQVEGAKYNDYKLFSTANTPQIKTQSNILQTQNTPIATYSEPSTPFKIAGGGSKCCLIIGNCHPNCPAS